MSGTLNIEKIEAGDIRRIFLARENPCNKGTFGYTALIGGSREYSGAAKLANLAAAAAAALRSGTGVVKLAVPESIADAVMPYILESTLFPMPEKDGHIAYDEEKLKRCIDGTKAIALGMGIGQSDDVEKVITYILRNYEGIVIIDADGLNVLSKIVHSTDDDICATTEIYETARIAATEENVTIAVTTATTDVIENIKNIKDTKDTKDTKYILPGAKCKVVLTPHLKEFSRLTGKTIDEINTDPIRAAADFAGQHGCTVLLKGPTTVVTDGRKALLVDRGCPGMATAGSGDVLSGILAAICGYNGENLLTAVAAAAYVNGLAGELAQDEYGDICMIASDTVAMIPKAIRRIRRMV